MVIFGIGNEQRYILIHLIAKNLGNAKSSSLPLLHVLTECDQVSFLLNEERREHGIHGSSMIN